MLILIAFNHQRLFNCGPSPTHLAVVIALLTLLRKHESQAEDFLSEFRRESNWFGV